MHAYSVDGHDRQVVYGVLATLAVVAALLLDSTLNGSGMRVWWWLDSPSVMGFFGLLYKLYDRLVWRILSPTPKLYGTWVGWSHSDHESGTRTPVVVHVRQSWTRIRITLETDSSVSGSLMAAVHTDNASGPGVSYEYLNEPKHVSAASTMHTHRGTVKLRLSADGKSLEGDYYTGRDRGNVGSLGITRVSDELVSRDEALAYLDCPAALAS